MLCTRKRNRVIHQSLSFSGEIIHEVTSHKYLGLIKDETGLSPPVKYFTDRSNALLLLWIFYVFALSCVCYVFVHVYLYVLCGLSIYLFIRHTPSNEYYVPGSRNMR